MKKNLTRGLLLSALAGAMALTGCATGRNYQPDLDSLNTRIATLEGQVSSKDKEIDRLEGELSAQRAAAARAEAEKRSLADRMDSMRSELDAKSKAAAQAPASDLK